MGMGQTPANVVARSLYLEENKGATIGAGHYPDPIDVVARSLYLDYNKAATSTAGRIQQPADVDRRDLFLFVNRANERDPTDRINATLYLYEAYTAGELFPWIEKIAPSEALPGQQVAIYGDGFGATPLAEGSVVRLGTPTDETQLGPGLAMGVVSWSSRSPGLYPANSGIPTEPAIVVTVPETAESGMLSVEQTT